MSERLLAVSQIIGGVYNVCICSKDHRRQAFTTSVIGVVEAVGKRSIRELRDFPDWTDEVRLVAYLEHWFW